MLPCIAAPPGACTGDRTAELLMLETAEPPTLPDPPEIEPRSPPELPAPPPAAPPFSPLFPEPFVGTCGKYPPGEGSPSGPSPGLRLRTNAGGLQR